MRDNRNHTTNGLLFDLDNTLYFYDPAHAAGLQTMWRHLAHHTNLTEEKLEQEYELAKHQVKHRLVATAASHHRLLYIQALLENLNLFSPALVRETYNQYWDAFFAAMQPLPGMLEVITALAKKYAIGVVTNFIADIQYRKLEQLGIAHLVQFLVTSEEIGREKPDPQVFLAACKKMKLQPQELCMVGDDLAADIIPAQQLGMETYWLVPQTNTSQSEFSLFKTCSTFYELEKRLL
jgi:putative hydrolase of the HAD superfamily